MRAASYQSTKLLAGLSRMSTSNTDAALRRAAITERKARHDGRERDELGDSGQGGSSASARKLVARTDAAARRLLLTKSRLLTESVIDLKSVYVVTRVRSV